MDPGPTLPAPRRALAGLVLSGGRSLRFGGEKAAARLGGKPLLLWATGRLQGVCGAVAVNTRPGTEAEALAQAHRLPVLHDAPDDADGPLSGIKAGLIWAVGIGARSLAVSPCDAPLLPEDLFARLYAAAGEDGAAMAVTADGRQPLCAVWPVAALSVVTAALAEGAHPATWRMLEALDAKPVRFDPPEAFANLNTRQDLAAAAERLEQGGP